MIRLRESNALPTFFHTYAHAGTILLDTLIWVCYNYVMVYIGLRRMKHFNITEFDCQYSGRNEMKRMFLLKIDELREECGFPFAINSGYRDPNHPKERDKDVGGTHTQGIASDIRVHNGFQRALIVKKAIELGFKGIGVAKGFVHVDMRDSEELVMWTY